MRVFVDTSALLAILDRDDARHSAAEAIFRSLLRESELVTHNYIHVEAIALTRRKLGVAAAEALMDSLLPSIATVWVDEAMHRSALEAHRTTGGGASFVDHVSFTVMRQLGIDTAFAFDRDFDARGLRQPAVGDSPPPHRLSEDRAQYGSTTSSDLVSVAEIASRSGRSANTVQSWRRRHRDFPRPVADLAAAPIWAWTDVAGWIAGRAHGR